MRPLINAKDNKGLVHQFISTVIKVKYKEIRHSQDYILIETKQITRENYIN